MPSGPNVPSPASIASAALTPYPSQPASQPALQRVERLVNLGQLGEFQASITDEWNVVDLVVQVPNHHWPGHSTGETPCEIVGFIRKFPWPSHQSQSNESAYVVETQGNQYALQPLQIEDALPPLIRQRIGARPPGNRPRNCEWDPCRRGFFDKTTGAPHLPGTRSVVSQDEIRANNTAAHVTRRSDTYDLERSEESWLIPHGGDIDKWRWLPTASFAFPAPNSRGFAKLERTWRLVHMDLRVGPLGGFKSTAKYPGEANAACVGCRAPLFLGETRTKCCSIYDARGRAAWCGPFCSFPCIPRPTAEAVNKQIPREFGALWYGDDGLSKHFLANTRLFSSRYAFSSLQATRERHPGKPKFQIKGTVYYRMAPSMVPPPHWKTGAEQKIDYAQMYTLDPDEGFDERLSRLLDAKDGDAESDDEDGGNEDGGAAARRKRREPVAQQRLKAVLRTVNTTMHANPLALQYKAAFDASEAVPQAHVRFHTDPGQLPKGGAAAGAHERQYNTPTAGSVSVVLHAPRLDAGFDVLVQRKVAGGLQRVSYSNSSYDALAFPLYFPRGTATWHHGFKVPVVKKAGAKPE